MKSTTIATKAGLQLALGTLLMLSMAGASAQLYKWTDAQGKVHFTDKPPPPNAKQAAIKPSAGGAASVPLPYALAQAAQNHPVVLYTGPGCQPCDLGRTFLKQRGIPFAEKTVDSNEDQARLKEAGNTNQLPLLVVGRNKNVAFEAGAWGALLSNASYPAENILPKNYQYPQAVPAAPVAPPKAAAARAQRGTPAPTQPANTAPPGFQF